MKTKFFFAVFVSACLLVRAQGDGSVSEVNVKGSKVTTCLLNKVKSKVITIPLSSLVENCTLVPLEFHDDALFNTWFTTVTDKLWHE